MKSGDINNTSITTLPEATCNVSAQTETPWHPHLQKNASLTPNWMGSLTPWRWYTHPTAYLYPVEFCEELRAVCRSLLLTTMPIFIHVSLHNSAHTHPTKPWAIPFQVLSEPFFPGPQLNRRNFPKAHHANGGFVTVVTTDIWFLGFLRGLWTGMSTSQTACLFTGVFAELKNLQSDHTHVSLHLIHSLLWEYCQAFDDHGISSGEAASKSLWEPSWSICPPKSDLLC